MQWTLEQIIKATKGRLLYGPPGRQFSGISIDSRASEPGQVFVAIRGERHDGHAFVDQVVAGGVRGLLIEHNSVAPIEHEAHRKAGAACVAVDDTVRALGALAAHQRNLFDIPVVAVTGSNGKTSTRQMTALVAARTFRTLSTVGNLNNEIGVPLTLFHLHGQHQAAVIELGMNHPGEIDRLGAICRPKIGMITNVAPAHLEFLHTLEGVARAKGELIAHIDPQGTVVLNRDDPHVSGLASSARCRVLYFGMSADAHVRAEKIAEKKAGVFFDLLLPSGRIAVQLQTPGRFMVSNALAAAAAGHLLGMAAEQIKAGLESFTPVKGRLNLATTENGVHLIDDTYNANPSSMVAAMDTLDALKGSGRAFVVLGDMLELGPQAPALHRRIGERAAACMPVRLYAFGPNADSVSEGARSAGLAAERICTDGKDHLTADLIQHLKPGDWLLIKGSRGMAMETVVEAVRKWGAKPDVS
jgi:UDP-N-acetylmuramoyl-tripeptide--D-alanyl-D-alanine ligase